LNRILREINGMAGDGDLFGLGEDGGEAVEGEPLPAFPAPRRGPGRPAGAANRRTMAIKALYEARGFRDPVLGMGELSSSDPVELWRWLREQTKAETGSTETAPTLMEVVQLQQVARRDLAPFIHGKAPIRVEVDDRRLPVLVMDLGSDQVSEGRAIGAVEAMTIGMAESEQNQGVGDDED